MSGRVNRCNEKACPQDSSNFEEDPSTFCPEKESSSGIPALLKAGLLLGHHLGHCITIRDSFNPLTEAYQTLLPLWSICLPVFPDEGNMSPQTPAFSSGCFHLADHSKSDVPAGTPNTRTDSGVGLSEPEEDQHQDIQICCQPEACELSPDMSRALQRFSIPHNCKFLQAKRELVDKIVGVVMENTSKCIMTLMHEELRKRGVQFEDDDGEEEDENEEDEEREEAK